MGKQLEALLSERPAAGALDRPAVLDEWVAAYGDGVLKLAYLHLKDRGLAEDVFQEVFTRVYLHLDRFRGEASPRTWIYRITVNLCRDKLGLWAARKVVTMAGDALAGLVGDTADTEDAALANVDAEVLLEAVLQLPLEFRAPVLLAYYEDMDLKQVAAALGLPPGTVRSRLHRARQRLRLLLWEGGWGR